MQYQFQQYLKLRKCYPCVQLYNIENSPLLGNYRVRTLLCGSVRVRTAVCTSFQY